MIGDLVVSSMSVNFISLRWRVLLSVFLACSVLVFVVLSLHWPMVNDPAQLRYAYFMMNHGMAPYRDLIGINMPGVYLTNWVVIHGLGAGPLAWRIFDLLLMVLALLSMLAIAWPYDWFAGIFAAALFILAHGRDGAMQTGQRDLIIAVMFLCAYAFLFRAMRTGSAWAMFGFGLAAGIAMTVKPTPIPFVALLFVLAGIYLQRNGRPWLRPLATAFAGLLIPLAAVLAFLLSEHALGSFLSVFRITLPYYAMLGRRSDGALLMTLSPSIWGMLGFVLLAAFWKPGGRTWKAHLRGLGVLVGFPRNRQDWDTWEIKMLGLGILFGIFSFLGQGKGMIYHRYPMLAFLLLWGSIQISMVLRGGRFARTVGVLAIVYGIVLAPCYVREADRSVWSTAYIDSLSKNLNQLGGSALNGKVQCLATEAECATTLYRMHLAQATGLFYDYLVFGPADNPAIQLNRAHFWKELEENPPQVFVVHTNLYPNRDGGYVKLTNWPQFAEYLGDNYTLYADRQLPISHGIDMAYRIYVRRDPAAKIPEMTTARLR